MMKAMKNLMIYISPTGSFDNPRPDLAVNDAGQLVKVQIENSLRLGWKKSDILLYTNFDYQYGDFKAKILNGVMFLDKHPQASKINAIVQLFNKKLIKDNEIYWFHDLDAFQLQRITEKELRMENFDLALTDYGRMPLWNTGVIFFKKNSYDIFKRSKKNIYGDKIDDERALYKLTTKSKAIRKRIKKLNKSYNFTPFNLRHGYKVAIKPLKVAHFHPLAGIKQLGVDNALNFYKGMNKINTPLITGELLRILKYHRLA